MFKPINTAVVWLYRVIATRKILAFTITLFAAQAVWLAFSAYYPLPFDEYFHVGLIQLYAKQWSPLIAEQPAVASIYGDITREPSYLYHYLISFPYRFFELFTDNEMVLIIATRLVNVAFVVGGLILFRKLLLKWGLSKRVTHIALLAFVMTPITTFLAAHVNYDNLMFLLTPIFLLVATNIVKNNKNLVRQLMLFTILGVTTVLIKRTFLPLAAIVAIYVVMVLWRRNSSKIIEVLHDSWQQTRKGLSFAVLTLGLILSLGLFAERYGGNMVSHGSVWPNCQEVQTREVCAGWGPWNRDYIRGPMNRPSEPPFGNPASFTQHWIDQVFDGYFVLFSHTADAKPLPDEGDPYGRISGAGFMPLPLNAGYVALTLGSLAMVLQIKRIWRNWYLRFALILSIGFIAATFIFNYTSYLNHWRPVAIQARYTYPIMIILFALMIQASSWTIDSFKLKKMTTRNIKIGLLTLFAITYVWGGGAVGWIVRSPDSWHWQNQTVQNVNETASNILKYLVIN